MPRKWQFARCRPDAHAIVGGRSRRAQQERGLGEVGPPGEGGHLVVGEVVGVMDDGERVAQARDRGEDINLGEPVHEVSFARCES